MRNNKKSSLKCRLPVSTFSFLLKFILNESNWPYHGRSFRMVTFAWLVTPLPSPPVGLLGPALPARRAPGMPHGHFPSRSYLGSHGAPQLLLPLQQQPQWCRCLAHVQNIQLEHLEILPGMSSRKNGKIRVKNLFACLCTHHFHTIQWSHIHNLI